MTEKGTPFKIIGTMIVWIKDTLTVVFEPRESEEQTDAKHKEVSLP